MKEDVMTLLGKVIKKFPKGQFNVELENEHVIMATPSGKMRKNNINILVGDWVDVELSPYDLTRGRISWRYVNKPNTSREA